MTPGKETYPMAVSEITALRPISAEEASPKVAEIYRTYCERTGSLSPSTLFSVLGNSDGATASAFRVWDDLFQSMSVPMPMALMIMFAVAAANHCDYCSSAYGLGSMSFGVSEETLCQLATDLDAVVPDRTRDIVKFAVKCATDSHAIDSSDYDRMRGQGLTDAELVECISIAATAQYFHTLASALKLRPEQPFDATGGPAGARGSRS